MAYAALMASSLQVNTGHDAPRLLGPISDSLHGTRWNASHPLPGNHVPIRPRSWHWDLAQQVRVAILDHTRPLSVSVAAIHRQDSRQALGLEYHFGHPGRVTLAEAEEIDSFRPGEPSITVVIIGALASLACVLDRSPAIFQMSVLGMAVNRYLEWHRAVRQLNWPAPSWAVLWPSATPCTS